MIRMISLLVAALTICPAAAFAQQARFGTAAEARAMLHRVVLELKADETKALETFNAGTGRFRDRDLYPFCFSMTDGSVVAHARPDQLGLDVRTVADANGRPFGSALFAAAKPNRVVEVSYMYPRPNAERPEPKTAFVTQVGEVGCGVGYYRDQRR